LVGGAFPTTVSTLVVCVDRGGDLAGEDGGPVVGREAIEQLVMAVGVDDPEDSRVNCLLETLRVGRDVAADGGEPVVAVVSGGGDGVNADRAVARHTDALVEKYDPDSAVVVTDSAEDERLVPIVESRIRVDAVDRVVVRQSHDIESTYYVLKQFLADEELRATVLVPIGAALLAFPVLLLLADSLTVAVSAIAAVIGVFLLYKGLGVDDWLAALPGAVRDAFYSGQVSLVTYVVGAGLATVGLFAGAIDVSGAASSPVIAGMRFLFAAVPWLALAALTASTGRLVDEFLSEDRVPNAFLNLPFGVVAVGLVVRGFSAYFLERAGEIPSLAVPAMAFGPVSIEGFQVTVWTRLAAFVLLGIAISLVGVRFSSYVADEAVEEEFPRP
jgi:putative membrane protein